MIRLRRQNTGNGLWVMGYCLLPLVVIIVSVIGLTGCGSSMSRVPPIEVWPDMKHQEKFKPQTASGLFADGRSNRPPVAGTVARGHLKDDSVFYTGMEGELYAGKNPLTIDVALLKQGQTKFNIYCTPCHDRAGTGRGIVPTRVPQWLPSDLTDDRIKGFNDGEIFNVITRGRRSMPSYRFQIEEKDRWAIVAYVRALQRASNGTVADVPQELRSDLR